ncbi:hypothetical protein AAZV13_08G317900 [Glycine max]
MLVVSNLLLEKSSKAATPKSFLFGFLSATNILNVSQAYKDALEKKIGL